MARALALACRGHRELVLENLALRQQLNALRRTGKRPRLGRRDRLFWIVLANAWRHWRAALVLVHPEHRRAMASRVAPPAMDAALGAGSCRPPAYGDGHSQTGQPDGGRDRPTKPAIGASFASGAGPVPCSNPSISSFKRTLGGTLFMALISSGPATNGAHGLLHQEDTNASLLLQEV